MAALWPVVKARLIAAIPTLGAFAGVTVFDGPPTERPEKYVTVGYVEAGEFGGAFDMPDSPIDTLREERGQVVMEFVDWTGDNDLPTKEAYVFGLFDALDTWVRSDQRLGVMPAASTAELGASYVPVLNKGGSAARLVVTLTYFARH